MSANGRVLIGFSDPYVGKYTGAGQYTGGMPLARGVSVDIQPEVSEGKEFYADNRVAETSNGKFVKAALKLVVDGLLPAAEKFIYGLSEPEAVTYGSEKTAKFTKVGDVQAPWLGIGYVAAYKSDGVLSYVPTILTKGKFKANNTSAATGENNDENYQTQELEATLYRDDAKQWKWIGDAVDTQEEAAAIVAGVLGAAAGAAEVVKKT